MKSTVEVYPSLHPSASRSIGALATVALAASLILAPGAARAASTPETDAGPTTTAAGASTVSGAAVTARGKTAASAVQTFVQRCASYIHLYGGGAYATVGSATPYYVSAWENLGLDFYEIHYYPWMDFSGAAGSGLPSYASLNLDRPCIVGEYASADASYNTTDTMALSAEWYLDTIYNNGYAGGLAWSYAAGDSASDWSSFQPVFTAWGQTHSSVVGPK